MSEPSRLLDSSANPALCAVLSAGLADAPRPEALPRVAAALGLTAGAVVVAVAVPAGAAASTLLFNAPGAAATGASAAAANAGTLAAGVAVGSAAKLSAASGLSVLVLSKWLVAGAVAGVLVAGSVNVVERANVPVRALPSRSDVALSAASPPERDPAPRPLLNPVPEAPSAPEAEPVVAPSAARSSVPNVAQNAVAAPVVASASRALGAEAARIDAARRALAGGDFERALGELDAYQRERELGVLDREARILRIQVLVLRGDRERAVVLARSYLASHPDDAHAARLRALVENGGRTWPNAEGKP